MARQGGTAAAGWYRDPTGRHQHRYWDGVAWGHHVANDGVSATDPLERRALDLDRHGWRSSPGERDAQRWRERLWWRRAFARGLDSLILLPIQFIAFIAVARALELVLSEELLAGGNAGGWALVIAVAAVPWLYWAASESSLAQGTLGKRALGLKVAGLEGRRVTFGRASARFWAGCLLAITTCFLGLWLPLFFKTNQTLHDLVTGCVVVRVAEQ